MHNCYNFFSIAKVANLFHKYNYFSKVFFVYYKYEVFVNYVCISNYNMWMELQKVFVVVLPVISTPWTLKFVKNTVIFIQRT